MEPEIINEISGIDSINDVGTRISGNGPFPFPLFFFFFFFFFFFSFIHSFILSFFLSHRALAPLPKDNIFHNQNT